MFQNSWNLSFTEWNSSDSVFYDENIPGILKESRTRSFSDASENEKEIISEEEFNSSPIRWIFKWFQGQKRAQKFLYCLGVFGLFLIMLASVLVITDNISEASQTNHHFDFDYAATKRPGNDNLERLDSSSSPTQAPTNSPSNVAPLTYVPGNLTTLKFGLMLSEGLDTRIVALSHEAVNLVGERLSELRFHGQPDAGATFPDNREENKGGWIYVSNSEIDKGKGGVGALTFNKNGEILDYQYLLKDTTMNCGGGKTPWNTWVSCEEYKDGQIYQVDPSGEREPQVMTMGSNGGQWESFAFDIRNKQNPSFFVTEDARQGAMLRFIPDSPDWSKPWEMLHGNGTIDYLMLVPNATNDGGMFTWTTDEREAKINAAKYYPFSEGIDVSGNTLFFVCKNIKMLFVLDLDVGSYYRQTTTHGLFDGQPDQVKTLITPTKELLYFTEEAGENPGIHGRDSLGNYFTVAESHSYQDETTGLAFSPDGMFMYVAYQGTGILFAMWRKDNLPFNAAHLDIKYHSSFGGE